MDTRKLEALKQVVDEGSFTLAARRLGRSQSRLSQQIRSLEVEVGEPLLVRGRPKVSPTEAGQRILARAERVLMDVAAIKDQDTHRRRGEDTGRIRIAATPLAITYLYGRLLAHMQATDFIYYLPAYMRYAIRHVDESIWATDVIGSVVFALSPSKKDPGGYAHQLAQLALLDSGQKRAIVQFCFLCRLKQARCSDHMQSRRLQGTGRTMRVLDP